MHILARLRNKAQKMLLDQVEHGTLTPWKLRILLLCGAEVNKQSAFGWTPLMRATENGHYNIVRFLLNTGADVRAKNEAGITALMIAVGKRDICIVQFLLEMGAGVNTKNMFGFTPLALALCDRENNLSASEARDNVDIITLLRTHGGIQ